MTSSKVRRIEDEKDRILLYIEEEKVHVFEYHVIATRSQAEGIKVGDTIEYEPEGINFGWFVRKK